MKPNPKVLVVDDQEDMLMLVSMQFELAGAEVTKEQSSVAALELIKAQSSFDMIVVDIRMPKMGGHELTQKIREVGFKGAIIACTSVATGDGRRKGSEVGITRYLGKETLSKEVAAAILQEYC